VSGGGLGERSLRVWANVRSIVLSVGGSDRVLANVWANVWVNVCSNVDWSVQELSDLDVQVLRKA
jgi:hypothetical protein